jgi:hypothetical protein
MGSVSPPGRRSLQKEEEAKPPGLQDQAIGWSLKDALNVSVEQARIDAGVPDPENLKKAMLESLTTNKPFVMPPPRRRPKRQMWDPTSLHPAEARSPGPEPSKLPGPRTPVSDNLAPGLSEQIERDFSTIAHPDVEYVDSHGNVHTFPASERRLGAGIDIVSTFTQQGLLSTIGAEGSPVADAVGPGGFGLPDAGPLYGPPLEGLYSPVEPMAGPQLEGMYSPLSTEAGLGYQEILGPNPRARGHTLREHMGRGDLELFQRLQNQRRLTSASTFTDRAAAEAQIRNILNDNTAQINDWLVGRGPVPPDRPLALTGQSNTTMGRSWTRGAPGPTDVSGITVVLVRVPGPLGTGYRILTAYPTR